MTMVITYQEFSSGTNFSALKKTGWKGIGIITATSVSLNVMKTSSTQEKQKRVPMLPRPSCWVSTTASWRG
jgi:hypothetical protein